MKWLIISITLFYSILSYSQETFTVYFDFNKYALSKEARMQLDSFLLARKNNMIMYTISLDGYCDPIGTNHYNTILSENRVAVVKKYLFKNGIVSNKITNATGHGEKDPVNENKTKEERQLNRRVKINIIDPGSLSAIDDKKTLSEKIADPKTLAGSNIVLKNMNFYGGTPFLLPESFATVDELFEIMRVNQKLIIQIQGHICCTADSNDSPYKETGNGLSEERARVIYAELTGKGIEPERISYRGFGHSRPIYPFPEKTEEERIANRRVEIKIISK